VGSKGKDGKPVNAFQLQVTGDKEEGEAAPAVHQSTPGSAKKSGTPPWVAELKDRAKRAGQDPDRFYRAFLSNLSKSLFVLMPLFAGLLMLLHLRSKSLFVDHMVLSLHHHVVSFLAILLLMGLAALPGDGWGCLPGFVIFLAPPVHLAASLERLFRRGWGRSIVKAALVSAAYGFIVSVALVGLTILSLPKAH
jgi:hypothetical protein